MIKRFYNKLYSDYSNAIHRLVKQDHCILCGKKMDSACNSHVVPKFVLKELSENGKICYGTFFNKKNLPGLEGITGINNAHTFRLICRHCDKEAFKHYENQENLINFDNISPWLKNNMLCQMALKSHISHFQTKLNQYAGKVIASESRILDLEELGKYTPEYIDLVQHLERINAIKEFENSETEHFHILYNNLLDYTTDFSTQTLICYVYDLNGKKIFNCKDLSLENEGICFYLMVLPTKGKTRVLFYIDIKDCNDNNAIVKQIEDLSDDEKLHFIFVSLIVHDQEFYIRPSKALWIKKNDKKLVKLYQSTDQLFYWPIDNRKRIINFRKFNNYLSGDKYDDK